MTTTITTYVARHEPCGEELIFTDEQAASLWLKAHDCPRGIRSAGSIRCVIGMDPAYSTIPNVRQKAAKARQARIEKLLA